MRAITWAYRDGSVHVEVKFAAFFFEGELLRHLDGEKSHVFETACNKSWWGKSSSSGWADTHTITCPDCRNILQNADVKLEI